MKMTLVAGVEEALTDGIDLLIDLLTEPAGLMIEGIPMEEEVGIGLLEVEDEVVTVETELAMVMLVVTMEETGLQSWVDPDHHYLQGDAHHWVRHQEGEGHHRHAALCLEVEDLPWLNHHHHEDHLQEGDHHRDQCETAHH